MPYFRIFASIYSNVFTGNAKLLLHEEENCRNLGLNVPWPSLKGEGYTPDVAIRAPGSGPCPFSGSPLSTPCNTHRALQQHRLLGVGCLCAISYLCTFAHPGPLRAMTWPLAWPAPVSPPQGSFPGAPALGQDLSSGVGSWPSLGIPGALCPPHMELIYFLTQPAEHCMPQVLTMESWKE